MRGLHWEFDVPYIQIKNYLRFFWEICKLLRCGMISFKLFFINKEYAPDETVTQHIKINLDPLKKSTQTIVPLLLTIFIAKGISLCIQDTSTAQLQQVSSCSPIMVLDNICQKIKYNPATVYLHSQLSEFFEILLQASQW